MAELEQLYRIVEVLQSMFAEVDERHVVAQPHLCLGRQHNLSAVPGGGDARRQMHIQPDVVILDDVRLTCVQTHAYPDRP